MNNLDEIQYDKKTGRETFHQNGRQLDVNLLAFWQWSASGLVGNALRGMLGEFIVASDLGCLDAPRMEWNAYDLETANGLKVEVKSAAYLQSWKQEKLSAIQFDIKPTFGWDAKTNQTSKTKERHADVYVFCVLNHRDKATVDPLNMEQWKFYILDTAILDKKVGTQQTISLSRLLKLEPVEARYGEIAKAIGTRGLAV
ncbi:MAG: hypothetical protein GY765_02300 [bacterium]|nr:hypothetical protein [bacterium]